MNTAIEADTSVLEGLDWTPVCEARLNICGKDAGPSCDHNPATHIGDVHQIVSHRTVTKFLCMECIWLIGSHSCPCGVECKITNVRPITPGAS